MKKIIGFSFLVLMVFVIGACTSDATDENTTPMVTTTEQMTTEEMTTEEETTENQEPTLNIVETAEAAGSFTTLLAALDQAGLSATLEGEGSFTVFAPTDQAFTDLLTALDIDAATLLGVENLSDILLYHVLDGAYYASDVVANAPFSMASLEGSDVNFTVMDGKAYINDVEIITTDILTSNGVIHVIEEVILLLNNIVETAEAAGSFTTLLAALDQAGLSATLEGEGSFTVFAPTDQAFTDLLTALDIDAATLLGVENLSDILLYHVLDGAYYASDVVGNAPFSMASLEGSDVNFTVMDGKAYINDVEIITTDILTSNGVIHVIEEVILPLNNIVETAEAAGSFTTLLAALDQAGLSATLEGEGSFTVFAPTDQAFTDLATSLSLTLEDILALSNLDQILLFHVIDGIYYSTDVINATPISIASMQTTNLDFTLMNQMIYVNGVEVVKADILTTNGIIHVIGEVLLYE